jgi:hypothetical protein
MTLAAQVDEEVSALNGSAPPGERRRPKGVELTARGLSSFSVSQPSVTRDLKLPNWQASATLAWPQPEPFVPLFAPAAYDPRYSDQWWKAGEQQREAEAERQRRELAEAEAAKRDFYAPR